uniref:F-box domain-containing protein n=1 Tax=Salarias fasciatus TaxID=181472 RepID=A0A672HER7_SALFA
MFFQCVSSSHTLKTPGVGVIEPLSWLMAQPPPQLPAEVWILIFGHLSVSDKFRIRESCKFFKRLVDHASLWRGWTVILRFKGGSYNSDFWSSLRRRKVLSAVVKSAKAKDWKRLSLCLPDLSTVVLDLNSQTSLSQLRGFPHLKRLVVRNRDCSDLVSDFFPPCLGQQLTHLSICGVTFPITSTERVISALSQFTHLTSLTCHHMRVHGETFCVIESMITHLPKLKRLSVSVTPAVCDFSRAPVSSPRRCEWTRRQTATADLSSLELIDCWDFSFPPDVMMLMPGLSSLAVFYKRTCHEASEQWSFHGCHLQTWLRHFSQLSSLVVVRGPPVKMYAASIPATVTSLTLCVAGLRPEDLAAIALQVPGLLHLHVDPWPSHLGARTADIPQLFPKLKSLALRHRYVPEEDFLSLQKLQDLKHLKILDCHPGVSELINKLRAVTRFKLSITVSSQTADVLSLKDKSKQCQK